MRKHISCVSRAQFKTLCRLLPEPRARRGRTPLPNLELLPGILYVLKTGCSWEYLPTSVCHHHYSSCWRRLRFWQKHMLRTLWKTLLRTLDECSALNLETGQLDASLVPSPQFHDTTGYSGKHKKTGTKISLIADHEGVPLGMRVVAGNVHDVVCAEATVNQLKVGTKTRVKTLNADKGYDSQELRRAIRKRAMHPNIPSREFKHRRLRGRKPKQDKEAFKHRPFIERTFAWLKAFKKLKYRTDRTERMFERFALLGCIIICLRKILQ